MQTHTLNPQRLAARARSTIRRLTTSLSLLLALLPAMVSAQSVPPGTFGCEVHVVGFRGGQSSEKVFPQWLFPNGFQETFYGTPSLWDKMQDIASGDFDVLVDPDTWVLVADLAQKAAEYTDPAEYIDQVPFGELENTLGFDPAAIVVDEFGNATGIDLNGIPLSKGALVAYMVDMAKNQVDSQAWSATDWNDKMGQVYFVGGGACEGASVQLWKDRDYAGTSIVVRPGDDPELSHAGYDDWVSAYRVRWGNQTEQALDVLDVDSGSYALIAWDGQPVTVQGDGTLMAGGSGTRVNLVRRANGEYAIQAGSRWLTLDANGLTASADGADFPPQHFQLADADDGKVGIKNSAGYWLFTDENIGGRISVNPGLVPHWWTFRLVGPLADVESGHYALQTYDGRPVTVQGDGSLHAGGNGTRFYVGNRNDGSYAIQGNSTWLNADANGLRSSATNGENAPQHFFLTDAGNGQVGIVTSAGNWLFTDNNYGGLISSNPNQIYDWWPFRLVGPLADVDSGHYALQSYDGRLVTVQGDGTLIAGGGGTRFYVGNRNDGSYAIQGNSTWLNADANGLRSSMTTADNAQQHFYLQNLSGSGNVGVKYVGIKSVPGGWLFTDNNIGGRISSNPNKIYDWWPFRLVELADVESGYYGLQSYDGRPVTVQGDGTLMAGGSGTRFYLDRHDDGIYNIEGNSTWLNADANGLRSSATDAADSPQQQFMLVDVGDGKVGIHSKSGYWLFTDDNYGGLLSQNPGQVHDWWPFTLVRYEDSF